MAAILIHLLHNHLALVLHNMLSLGMEPEEASTPLHEFDHDEDGAYKWKDADRDANLTYSSIP